MYETYLVTHGHPSLWRRLFLSSMASICTTRAHIFNRSVVNLYDLSMTSYWTSRHAVTCSHINAFLRISWKPRKYVCACGGHASVRPKNHLDTSDDLGKNDKINKQTTDESFCLSTENGYCGLIWWESTNFYRGTMRRRTSGYGSSRVDLDKVENDNARRNSFWQTSILLQEVYKSVSKVNASLGSNEESP